MVTVFWGLLIFGILYALISLLFSDIIEHAFESLVGDLHLPFLQPTILVSGLTVLGGAGILLTKYTTLSALWVILLAVVAAIIISTFVFFLYIKPMQNSEVSLSYSIHDLVGSIAEVSIAIPAKGCGEVIVKKGIGHSNHIASSWDKQNIPQDTRVVVVEVSDDTLYVTPLDTDQVSIN